MKAGTVNLKDLWKKAREKKSTGTFDELDDGRYLCAITDSEVNNSQATNRLQMFIEFKIQEGEFTGKTKRMYIGLDNEMGIQIAVGTLSRLGLDIEDPSELETELKQLNGKIVKIRLKTKQTAKGDFQNVFIEKVVGSSEPAERPSSTKKDAEEVEEPAVEAELEDVELKVGLKVIFTLDKKEVEGEVSSIEEEEGKAIVKYKGKKYRVSCDKLSIK